ncbi:MAG: N-acetylglucosamine-6-phosphate deacetylase [Chloroflexi bacterium]|nr:N-acetylglucosamine-6-phosphate deacetylase [Chloroflexota bacterium]MCI0577411.1 N-acetylglucosamine-6-phosphate deacetylase [Chloroflexota bacterium]MCI0649603.1 N-acetylglucosamine-6-phosphate deacetylase [Chloroflexota bacterium]MCI0725371.1 N-acetylglucosamine-6-phosphate deacetylase [Chloroflexota bacterium]
MVEFLVQGDLLWPDGQIRPGFLTVEGEKIVALSETEPPHQGPGYQVVQVPPGGVAAPGFIDLQLNGAFGHDFTGQPRQIASVARALPRFGITAFLPTLVSTPLEQYSAAIAAVKEMKREPEMAAVLGLHLEGPYLNRAKAGSHAIPFLRQPALEELVYFDSSVIRLVTLAPELPGALPFIRSLRERGIQVGIGHSTATYEQTLAAADAGVSWSTHLFNAMGPLHHRHPGIVGALLADERLRLALIANNVHVHPAILRLVAAAKGASGVTLISDAVAAAGMPQGKYTLGSQTIHFEADSVRLNNGTLAGSMIMLDRAVYNMVHLAGRPPAEALQMASATPALVLQAPGRGQLTPGYQADLVILDPGLKVWMTIIKGRVVYQAS